MFESSTGSARALLLRAAQAAQFGNIVNVVYAAMMRDARDKGTASRFHKVDRHRREARRRFIVAHRVPITNRHHYGCRQRAMAEAIIGTAS